MGVAFSGSLSYNTSQKTTEYFVFRAGCDSPLAVKSATGYRKVSADPVQLRDQQYSLDGRR